MPGSAAWRSTPTPTATRCTSGSPTRPTRWAAPRRARPTSTSTRSSTSRQQSGADAVHPGYGFLAENAAFAQAVIDAGLTWIGPPPAAIDALGDKVQARHIAARGRRPAGARHGRPGRGRRRGLAFADEHGLPDRHQGGVRRRRARPEGGPRRARRSPSCSTSPSARRSPRSVAASASSSATSTSRGTSRRRCLADTHGNVVVVVAPATARCSAGTRSWSRRRPRRSSPRSSEPTLYESSKAILREAGYVGAGTCEFLVGAGRHHLLPRGQHPTAGGAPGHEETSGVDLVREQFRDRRRRARSATTTPAPRGHAIEFRINAEDAGRDFLPAPGPITTCELPSGPGVRVDAGVRRRRRPSPARSTRCWPS